MNYEPFIERDLEGVAATVRAFAAEHGRDEAWKGAGRFAVLAYAPSQHAKHALLACLAAWDLRDHLGGRFEDVVVECAKYAAASRQPWSEPPLLDPPAVEPGQRADREELRAAIASGDRLRGERWLAARIEDPSLKGDVLAVAAEDFADYGHKLVVANAAFRMAELLGEKGRYAALRVGIWEMTAYRGERHRPGGAALGAGPLAHMLVERMQASRGDAESAHAVFLLDAALQCGEEEVLRSVREYLSRLATPAAMPRVSLPAGPPPVYKLARDCGEYLEAHAVAHRFRAWFPDVAADLIVASAAANLAEAPSLEDFDFA